MDRKPKKRSRFYYLFAIVLGLALCTGLPALFLEAESVAKTEVRPLQPSPEAELVDDPLAEKTQTPFDPNHVHRRLFGDKLINLSAAVVRLDVTGADPEKEAELLKLRPSYADAIAAANDADRPVLPSVNLLDGKAKQFDDGLYAALDQAYYKGLGDRLVSHVELVRRFHEEVGKDSPAAPFLAAALELAGVSSEATDGALKEQLLRDFNALEVYSKPAGFYTWNDTLKECFRFLRFLQTPLPSDHRGMRAVAQVLSRGASLRADYERMVAFYSKLTNPPAVPALTALVNGEGKSPVAFLPSSTSRETELFKRLFPQGPPPDVDLMNEMIRRVRSGDVNLRPGPESGWYDYQVYALETLLLPQKGEEHDKLLLTRAYKKRMLEAFKALITKRRETHLRQLQIGCGGAEPRNPPEMVRPRLRVEPCPSYYVRTARAYAFLANFLEATVGKEVLQRLHGLTKDGLRQQDLYSELHFLRDLFYGLYLVSAEDIGLKPAFLAGEPVDAEHCYQLVEDWLPGAYKDADIAADTRVIVPIFVDPARKVTRVWATLGVRLAKLDADFARPPSLKQRDKERWEIVGEHQLGSATYFIPVDEFAEVELSGLRMLTRDEFRALCNEGGTKEGIVAALQQHARTEERRHWWPWMAGGAAGLLLAGAVVLFFRWRRVRHG